MPKYKNDAPGVRRERLRRLAAGAALIVILALFVAGPVLVAMGKQ